MPVVLYAVVLIKKSNKGNVHRYWYSMYLSIDDSSINPKSVKMVEYEISYYVNISNCFWLCLIIYQKMQQKFQQTINLFTDRSLPVVVAASEESV